MPIAALSPSSNNWKIKAKVESKSGINTWSKGEKSWTKFTSILSDSRGGKIECIFWNDGATRYHEMLKEGVVYEFSNGNLKIQNRQWAKTDHSCQIHFGIEASITQTNEQ